MNGQQSMPRGAEAALAGSRGASSAPHRPDESRGGPRIATERAMLDALDATLWELIKTGS